MGLQAYIQFATEHPVCFLATVEGDQPRVRTFLLWFADETGFYFVPLEGKEITKQLKAHPKAEICFFNNATDPGGWKHLRVAGEVEFLEDEGSLAKAYENRSFLDDILGFSVESLVRPFRIAAGEAHFWVLGDNMKEQQIERLRF